MAKAARKRHVYDSSSNSKNDTKNGGTSAVRSSSKERTTRSRLKLFIIISSVLLVLALCAVVVAYHFNHKAMVYIHGTLVQYGIPGFQPLYIPSVRKTDKGGYEGFVLTLDKDGNTVTKKMAEALPSAYEKASITNEADEKIYIELDEADSLREKGFTEKAAAKYDTILKRYPRSPRANYGKAHCLDKLAEKKRSNALLEEAIHLFAGIFDLKDVPDDLLTEAGNRAVDRMHFRGWSIKAAKLLSRLSQRFPTNITFVNQLGVAYLLAGKVADARRSFQSALSINPHDGFAQVHMGFIYKTTDNDMDRAVPLLREGVKTKEPGTIDGRFYFHLGDALQRQGKKEEAYEIYKEGAVEGLFLSMFQRSLYNVDRLTGRPWWTAEQSTYKNHLKLLEANWEVIRDEGLSQLDPATGSFLPEEENLREKGDWKQFTLYQRGQKNSHNCKKTPKTCALIDQIPAAKGCKRGQVKYSVMQPGVHVWPHCGPTNCRIRAHLGLVIPEGPKIVVAGEEGKWKEGKFIIFDDSFEHEVWHTGTSFRLVLIVDFWHPDLTPKEKAELTPI